MNVLIAEDDPDMQKILGLYLRREGYQVDTVGDGAAAVDFLAEHPVDLVVLDWMMPVQNGLDTCREIRRLNIPVKILMLTAKGQNEDEVAGLSCGADDYLRKPFDMQVLLDVYKRQTQRALDPTTRSCWTARTTATFSPSRWRWRRRP